MDPHAHAFLDSERRRTRVASSREHRRRYSLLASTVSLYAHRQSFTLRSQSSLREPIITSLPFFDVGVLSRSTAFIQEAPFVKRTRGRFCRTARRTYVCGTKQGFIICKPTTSTIFVHRHHRVDTSLTRRNGGMLFKQRRSPRRSFVNFMKRGGNDNNARVDAEQYVAHKSSAAPSPQNGVREPKTK